MAKAASRKGGAVVLEKWFHHFSNTTFPRFVEKLLARLIYCWLKSR
jgi:hypothetical protein